jgi:dienelactone hydrolase
MPAKRIHLAIVAVLLAAPRAWPQAAAPARGEEYLHFIQAQADRLRAHDRPPATTAEWAARRDDLRRRLLRAWGGFPAKACSLEPHVLGVLRRDGYRVERLLFQTLPGVWMTANAYVPDGKGKHPAILAVHGHWHGARVDPVVQSRCIGAAKLGFFVLAVDAFGAGERAIGTKLGEYHGDMTGATLLPVGRPLSGLQVYENMRAVDYLRSRPEVDGSRIGVTGASGGGNQSMYAGAWDERLKAAVPVCSVGTYRAYLRAACCMCEVVPGALRFTEEGDLLGLTAPRGLMVINATQDAFQFSVGQAKKSLARASAIYRLYGRAGDVRHTVFDWHHDYNRPMREAMYGWMTLHLKGQGDGRPIPEPSLKPEDPETLRCFPGESRPADWMTIPRFAAREARALLARRTVPATREAWEREAKRRREALLKEVFGGFPDRTPLQLKVTAGADGRGRTLAFQPEPGLTLTAHERFSTGGKSANVAVILDLDGAEKAAAGPLAKALGEAGWDVVTVDLRATGSLAWPHDAVGRAPDHTTAEWGLWLGRPLLGQWTWDVSRLLDALKESGTEPVAVAVIGRGPAGVVALCAAATDRRVACVAAVDTLASYVTDVPYQGQRLGLMAPGILRDVGDVADIAGLCAPQPVVIAAGVWAGGRPVTETERRDAFRLAASAWRFTGAPGQLKLLASGDAAGVVKALK